MFMINRNIQQQKRRYAALYLKRTNRVTYNHIQARRQLSIWTIPKIVLATTNKSNRKWILGTLGAASVLSSFLGPVVWVAAGGAASVVTWRLFQKTKSWWNYLAPVISPTNNDKIPSMTDALLTQIGTHRAAELVRIDTIKELKRFFGTTPQGQKMLEDFGLDHPNDLVWEDVHKSEAIRLDKENNRHQIKVNFWLEDQTSAAPKGGGCEVTATAIVSGEGKIDLDEVKLSSPGWHKDEIVPLQS